MNNSAFLLNITQIYYNKIVIDRDDNLSLNDIIFVFPNRRAGLFFTDALYSITKKAIFAPNIIDINNFAASFTNIQKCSDIELLLLLYKSYDNVAKKREYEEILSFDNFISLGESILSDFNEIDKYLCDAEKIFSNISALQYLTDSSNYFDDEQLKAIENFWGNVIPKNKLENDNLNFNNKFISLWDILYDIYCDFNKELKAKTIGYEGAIYRNAIERLNIEFDDIVKYKRAVFIGFNILTNSENEIFSIFKKHNIADFYFDYPTQYSSFQSSIALNYSANLKEYKSHYTYNQPEEKQFPEINIYSTASYSHQTKIASQIVNDEVESSSIDNLNDNTAIVLADEQLLPHLIDNLPQAIDVINVTMGYQLNLSHIATLMNNIITLQSDITTSKDETNNYFYHKPLINILIHPYIQNMYPNESSNVAFKINYNNLIRVSSEELVKDTNIKDTLLEKIFTYQSDVNSLIKYMIEILEEIEVSLFNQNSSENTKHQTFDLEFTLQYKKLLIQLNNHLSQYQTTIDKKTFATLITKLLMSLKVQFEGKPLEGLQIMGKLEARLIDYDNVIIVGFNDEKIPGNSTNKSLIPYNLRIVYGLPTYEHEDAIYAYNFYRMLYRTKKLSLIYDSRKEGSKNEISRYFYQIKYLMNECVSPQMITINSFQTNPKIAASPKNKKDIVIEKNTNIINILDGYKNGNIYISASQLKNYITCPLKFYYNSIAKIQQRNEVNETMQSNIFGLIYHKSMELIYENHKELPIKLTSTQIDTYISEAFNNEVKTYNNNNNNSKFEITGFNTITSNIIKRFITLTLKFDKKRKKFEYLHSEEKYNTKLMDINFIGIVDRIDRDTDIPKTIHIIDYKTTSTSQAKSTYNIIELFNSIDHTSQELFQILLYCYLYQEKAGEQCTIQPNIYNVYKLAELFTDDDVYLEPEKIKLYVPTSLTDEDNLPDITTSLDDLYTNDKKEMELVTVEDYNMIATPFKWLLKHMMNEIFDKDIPFTTNPNNNKSKGCKYCPYIPLCNKEIEIADVW